MQAAALSFFSSSTSQRWESVGEGVRRQVLTHDDQLMLVKVAFERGGIGSRHRHFQTQLTYVESGVFTVSVGDEKRVVTAGDTFLIPSDVWHGVECIEAGMLLDVFSPPRAEFL
ncbi:cupin domain-containing protein [Hymenobacter sp. ASUV-10]|uniref:Cupin domain-containing protein n=1 Tax=Hymenobacter aranciens TaxID=3063996 RepID=A0ABT9BD41_9BACT|nr:cupin domain-containing protein [Hymenobacter sp. ASUV-10]MDO7874468.1 cupin domain-containing protein [Hymenobacter sp. ASUV-10]